MVPTATELGRLTVGRAVARGSVAVATAVILAGPTSASDPDPPVSGSRFRTRPRTRDAGRVRAASAPGTIRFVSTHATPSEGSHGTAGTSGPAADAPTLTVLVYSDDRNTRAKVITALGRRPAADLPFVSYVECATEPVVIARMDAGGIDLVILDGEAVPAGGMGIARQLKDEIFRCPPILVLVGRPDDAWLATWSRADAVVAHPVDPLVLAGSAASLLRERLAPTRAS